MFEMAVLWCYGHPWVVTAGCDLVTLACCMGVVMIMPRRRVATTAVPEKVTSVANDPVEAPQAPEPVSAPEKTVPVVKVAPNRIGKLVERPEVAKTRMSTLPVGKRRAVNQALAALNRWEATYRPAGQGLADLSRLAERRADRVTPVAVKEI